ncbi:kinase-like protein [Gigaspora margarita]|uniref:Kinase-like protein n=1 Tax=Gigaspora margarita TaxID=4874 RepID=A0A8H3WW69_GIGMA|nr:kinase-like protein [Gigaspora margarita]
MPMNTLNQYSKKLETSLKDHNIKYFDYSQYSDFKPIGSGGYADVHSAIFEGQIYAIKSLKNNLYLDDRLFKKVESEIKLLYTILHPNIIKFDGISRDEITGNFMLILQYANGGNLREHLKEKQNEGIYKILWNELIRIAIEITRGLKYLHDENIIHRDLHSMNILIHNGSALISDFGLSKKLRDSISTSSSGPKGIAAYVEPQCFLQDVKKIKLDKKSDVYSLGALFWELTSGIPPFNGYSVSHIFTKMSKNEREETIVGTPPCYANLFNKCWSFERNQRPTLNYILTELEKLSKEKTVEFITNIIDSDSDPSIYSEEFVEFITNIVDYDSETSICSGDLVLSNDSDRQSMLSENISTLFENTNTYDEGASRYPEWIKRKLESGLIQNFDFPEFSNVIEIARGGHSFVYSAEYRGAKIALKKFRNAEIRKIANELNQHITVNNSENVIRFLGITEGFGNSLMMVLQYANGGTLRDYLKRKIHEKIFIISWAEIILITGQIISGLQNLHDNNVIHGDLHPKNILIVLDDKNKFNKAAIADFGSASKSDDSKASIYGNSFNDEIDFGSASESDDSTLSTHRKYHVIEYADPQFFIDPRSPRPTFKSDIYSLGVMLWELTSGIRPYSTINNKIALYGHILKGLREKIIPGTPSSYSRLYKRCWSTNPKKRPKLREILREIHKIQLNGKDIYKDISNKIP